MKYLFLIWVLILSLVAASSAMSTTGYANGAFLSPASIKPQVLWRGRNPRYKTVLPTSDFRLPTSLISGLGTHHHPVSTQNIQAQQFFDQGLNLIYAFNHDEAARSFKYAAKLDPQLAMADWGIALANGPNINLDVDPPPKTCYLMVVGVSNSRW